MDASSRRTLALLFSVSCLVRSASAACASVDRAQSNGWLDRDGVTKRFSIQFNVVHWVPFTHISLTWPGEAVTLEHAYNVQREPGPPSETVVVTLGRTATNPPTFVIMGIGTQSAAPQIHCNTAAIRNVPPPSPPHAIACDLQPVYNTLNTWWAGPAPGENVEIVFRTWKDAGLVRLLYWGQTGLQVEAPVGATVHRTTVIEGDTLIELQLGTSCEDRVVDADGIVVSQPGQMMNCVPHRAETMHVTFNLKPPALHPPQISCQTPSHCRRHREAAVAYRRGLATAPHDVVNGCVRRNSTRRRRHHRRRRRDPRGTPSQTDQGRRRSLGSSPGLVA